MSMKRMFSIASLKHHGNTTKIEVPLCFDWILKRLPVKEATCHPLPQGGGVHTLMSAEIHIQMQVQYNLCALQRIRNI